MKRCQERDRFGHRCHVRGEHVEHSAFRRTWTGREKRKGNQPRPVTAGWSRRGATETRATILTRIREAAALAMTPPASAAKAVVL